MLTLVNLNRYAVPGSCVGIAITSPCSAQRMRLSSLCEFRQFCGVRGASSRIVRSALFDYVGHGDLLVMDGLTQSEYAHRTVPGLQGPRVNLTFRWVTQHIASCPLADVVGCVLPSCVQGLAEPGRRGGVTVENKMDLLVGCGPPSVNPCVFFSGTHLDSHLTYASSQLSASILSGGALLFAGSSPLGRGTAFATVTTLPFPEKEVFLFPWKYLGRVNCAFFLKGMVFHICVLLDVLVTKWEPTPGFYDAYSVGRGIRGGIRAGAM